MSDFLSESELLGLRVGDLVRWPIEPDRWLRVVDVYEPYRSAGGTLLMPFRGECVDNPLCSPHVSLQGPSSSGSTLYGTRRSAVQFQQREAA